MRRMAAIALIVLSAAGPAPAAGGPMTVNFQNADIDLVLRFYSEATGRPFLRSDAVRGFVTVWAPQPVEADAALAILRSALELKGFAMIEEPGGVTKIVAQNEAAAGGGALGDDTDETGDRVVSRALPLKFAAASEIRAQITPLLSRSGLLVTDDRLNLVVVTDVASNVRRLKALVETLDARPAQVLIEALVAEVSLTRETKLGVEWQAADVFHSGERRFDAAASQGFNSDAVITEGLRYAVMRADGRVRALVRALATDKNVNILSTPHIMTLNNQTATIRVGEEIPVLTQTRNIQGGETIRSFDFKPVTMELEVTPRVNPERDVLLKVHPLVRKILGFNAELNAPILATREAQTSVLVKDGQTVVIGGLIKDDRSVSRSKVPLLGDIPLLGFLFRRDTRSNEKTELLVFITPRVVLNDEDAARLTLRKETESPATPAPNRTASRRLEKEAGQAEKARDWRRAVTLYEDALAACPDEKRRRRITRRLERVRLRLAP